MGKAKKDRASQLGRFLFERATGRIIGPVAPIAREDWPFLSVAPHETLWRYMDWPKCEDLISSSTLYFSRPDKFTDPFEGRFSPGNTDRFSKSDEIFRSLYRLTVAGNKDYIEVHRNVVFISCWHRNTRENAEMWRAYTSTKDSVVITTSVRALAGFLSPRIMKYGVRYAELDFPRTEFSHNSLFFYKPSSYSFEQEYRLLRSPEEGETFYSENPGDAFRRVPMRLSKIVHRVITHPSATREFKFYVTEMLRKHAPALRRSNSALEI